MVMETLHALQKVTAGIDVHRMLYVVTVLIEHDDGTVTKQQRQFGGFKRDKRTMVTWLASLSVQLVVMESTGIYWKSPYALLEQAGILTWVVNAHHVKHVPGRKTDMADSEWLAVLGRFGLVRGSFIPPQDLRELRLVSRYRRKLGATLAAEKNRLHKVLDDAGIALGAVVSDIDGVSARRMIEGLMAGQRPAELAGLGLGKLREKQDDLALALDGDLSARHRFVLQQLDAHIRFLEQRLAEIDRSLFQAMSPYDWAWRLLQTLPGIDQLAACLILIEIGDDLSHFGSADRFASWAAVCPGNHESAGKRKTGKTRKGNAVIRSILCECANAARRTKSVFAAKYQSLVIRRGHKKAIVALAHKLIRTIFFVLTRRQPYRDSGFDYEAASVAKNAPRWIRALQRYGYWPQVVATA
jgi:transposase